MKEQDYMNIMGAIRGEYLEEAVSWDGSERRRIRQIRRMTVSFGAVAAALAIVVGMIAYKANKDKIPVADSVPDSSMTDETEKTQNMFGGHGEISVFPGQAMGDFFRDDEYWYHNGEKWSVNSGGRTVPFDITEKVTGFFSDGKEMFRLHEDKIYALDSYGKETLLVDMSGWQDLRPDPENVFRIERLGSTLLFESLEDGAQFARKVAVNLNNGEAQEVPNPAVSSCYAIPEGGFYGFGSIVGTFRRYDADGQPVGEDALWNPQDLGSLFNVYSDGRKLYAVWAADDHVSEYYDLAKAPKTYSVFDPETGVQNDYDLGVCECVLTQNMLYQIKLEEGLFNVYRSALDLTDKKLVYSIPVQELFDLEDEAELTMDMLELCEAGDTLVITLPYRPLISPPEHYPTHHGEEGVRIGLNTGRALYFGRNYGLGTDESSHADDTPAETLAVTEVRAEAETTAVTAAAAAVTTETSAVTTAVTTDSLTEEKRKEFAEDLINRYCEVYEGYAYGGLLSVDTNDVKEVQEPTNPDYKHRYDRVTSMNSVAEVRQKFAEVVSGQEYDNLIVIIEGAEGSDFQVPIYREFDGKLYLLELGKGAKFLEWLWDTLTIINVTETGYSASVKHVTYGGYVEIFYFDFTDTKDGSENSFRISHMICTSTDERRINGAAE